MVSLIMPLHLNPNKKKVTDYITGQCSILAGAIESNREALISELLKYERTKRKRGKVKAAGRWG